MVAGVLVLMLQEGSVAKKVKVSLSRMGRLRESTLTPLRMGQAHLTTCPNRPAILFRPGQS